ncbi:Chitin synthase, class 1 [Allomyces javanicus]|nr:Chitin synthase, class 1 [Allomyces javanicus]
MQSNVRYMPVPGQPQMPQVQGPGIQMQPMPYQQQQQQQPFVPQHQHYDMSAGSSAGGTQEYLALHTPVPPPNPANMVPPANMGRVDSSVVMSQGQHLVMDVPVPAQLADKYSRTDAEFRNLRYTACTADPDDFGAEKYSLRQTGQEVELFIVVTMYNEEPELFIKTLQGVHNNIRQMLTQQEWGPDGWKKIVVAIVSDGRTKINKDTLTLISLMGCYQEGLMRQYVNGDKTQAHIFEVTTEMNWEGKPEEDVKIVTNKDANDGVIPMQLLFCLKEANAKKINSHRWFFNAFAASLKPNVCVLLDVGTKPQSMSIYRLWRAFLNRQVGGACGEIAVEGSYWSMLNPIIAGQNFEYKMSNVLDKPLESVFGYISVLPGAFSAYRYAALQGRPLEEYFKGETLHNSSDIFTANMYLAEDRILCFELVAKKGCNWILRYEKNSQAVTDAPATYAEFISQRRRWLNGSTFAFLYAVGNMSKFLTSGQSFFRKFGIVIELLYACINFVFSYFSLANFFAAFYFVIDGYLKLMDNEDAATIRMVPTKARSPALYEIVKAILKLMRPLYVLVICLTFILALGNAPKSSRRGYLAIIGIFALISLVMLVLVVISTSVQFQVNPNVAAKVAQFKLANVTKQGDSSALITLTLVSLVATYGVYFVSSFLYLEWYHVIFNMLQYTLLLPTYVNVLQIYAYCNISDLSWGTKGDTGGGSGRSGGGSSGNNGQPKNELAEIKRIPPNDYFTNQMNVLNQTIKPKMRPSSEKKEKENPSKEENFKSFRTMFVGIWVTLNGLFIVGLLSPQTLGIRVTGFENWYLLILSLCVLVLTLFRFIGSLVYWIGHLFRCC